MESVSSCLCGVYLVGETTALNDYEDFCLGCVLLSSQCLSLSGTRRTISQQIQNLPKQFVFLSNRGWQIQKAQECNLTPHDVVTSEETIRIKAEYDKPRVGIWLKTSVNTGQSLGFIFVTLDSTLSQLREAIRDQLGDITPSGAEHRYKLFHFLDSNGWPINTDQEVHFSVLDLLCGGNVHVCYKVKQAMPRLDVLLGPDHVDGFKSPAILMPTVTSGQPMLSRESTTTTRSSGQSWTVKNEVAMDEMLDAKQILISYVRAEASEQALKLKRELTKMGYSVFLDVHEIKSGIDWQDSLNFAVRHCDVFVPLVTPRYGETQWTNREVKLADVLCKLILPVSFVEEWPPKVLAIQWATMQFIPWKPEKAVERLKKHGKLDRNSWELDYVHKAAKQIIDRLESSYGDRRVCQSKLQLQTLFSCPAPLPDEYSYLSQNREGKSLVVISAHPRQAMFVQELKDLFAGGEIEVWSSTELEHDDSRSDIQLFSQESIRERILSGESEGPPVIASQLSDVSMDSEFAQKNMRFQEKADEAGVILVVLSKEFALSKTCMQQIYYCEHRKKLIPIKYEDFGMPGWMSVLIGTGELEDRHSPNYKELLKVRVEDYIQGKTHIDKDMQRDKTISHQAKVLQAKLKRKLPETIYTYISGGAKFYNDKSKEICRHIGEHLAQLADLHLVTGGFPGVGDAVAKSYISARQKLGKPSNILHILPKKDPKVFQYDIQREDKTFNEVAYGDTIFSGESIRDRESIVSRVFDICILIEGGPGAAHEAEQFVWNDHIVIPVRSTGGAAGGKFDVPPTIFEIPVGVREKDWSILQDKSSAPAGLIGKTVANVVTSISENIIVSRSQQNSPQASSSKKLKSLRIPFPHTMTNCPSSLLSPVKTHKVSFSNKSATMQPFSRELSLNSCSIPFKPPHQKFGRQESMLRRKNSLDFQRSDTLIYAGNEKYATKCGTSSPKIVQERNHNYQLNKEIEWASPSSEEIDVPVKREESPTNVTVLGNNIQAISGTEVIVENVINGHIGENVEVSSCVPEVANEINIADATLKLHHPVDDGKQAGDSLLSNSMACSSKETGKHTHRKTYDDEGAPCRKRTRQNVIKAKQMAGGTTAVQLQHRNGGMGDNTENNVVLVKSKRKLEL